MQPPVDLEIKLCNELQQWAEAEGLPLRSADDYDDEETTPAQRSWLAYFIQRWDAVMVHNNKGDDAPPRTIVLGGSAYAIDSGVLYATSLDADGSYEPYVRSDNSWSIPDEWVEVSAEDDQTAEARRILGMPPSP